MPINQINTPTNLSLQSVQNNNFRASSLNEEQSKVSFGELLKSAMNEVNATQVQSDIATEKLAKGENIEIHDVMIAAQKASITMEAALQIRNKAVEAYQEMMRMQV